jgi:hypothetical protein
MTKRFFAGSPGVMAVLAACALFPAVAAAPATAVVINFDLRQDMPGQPSTVTLTEAGLSITASNPSSGYFRSNQSKGLCLYGRGACNNPVAGLDLTSFDVSFSQSVKLLSYTISDVSITVSAPTLTFSTGGSSTIESVTTSGTYNFANQLVVPAGSTLGYLASGGGNGYIRLSALSVDTVPDPVPAPLPILGAAGALAYTRRLRGLSSRLH